jgi:hypothetical protein
VDGQVRRRAPDLHRLADIHAGEGPLQQQMPTLVEPEILKVDNRWR